MNKPITSTDLLDPTMVSKFEKISPGELPAASGIDVPALGYHKTPTHAPQGAVSAEQPPSQPAQHQALPQGVTPAMAVQEAKAKIAAGKDPVWIANEIKKYGIDPSLYGIGAK